MLRREIGENIHGVSFTNTIFMIKIRNLKFRYFRWVNLKVYEKTVGRSTNTKSVYLPLYFV